MWSYSHVCIHRGQKWASCVLPLLLSTCSPKAGSLPEPRTLVFSSKLKASKLHISSWSWKSGMCQTPQVLCVGAGTHTQSSQLYNKHTLCCCVISAAPELLTFLLLSYTSLYILDTCPIWSHMTCKLFYLIYKLYFSLLDFFWITKFLIVMIIDLCFHFSLILLVLDLRTIT